MLTFRHAFFVSLPALFLSAFAASACPLGLAVDIEWNGSMWAGRILDGPNASGECYVTYDGWATSWNEWVVPSRIATLEIVRGGGCPVGALQEIEWNGRWWDGAVLDGPNASGHCYVTYEGWDATWNEWVSPDRLRNAN